MSVTGRWRIVGMDLWDSDAIDLVGSRSAALRGSPTPLQDSSH
jgi:hypothetical protein